MSSLTLERARANHEDIEAYEAAVVAILEDKPRTNKERVWQQHRIHNLIGQIQARSKDLYAIYEDKDGALKEELSALRGREAFPTFYAKLEHAKEYHQKHPDLPIKHHPNVQEEAEPHVPFSGEEVFGKYLDLQSLHTQFYALPQTPKWDYTTYLNRFTEFSAVPATKKNAAYGRYVQALWEYLSGFLARTQPLTQLNEVVGEKAEKEFEALWKEGRLPGGWPKPAEEENGGGAGGEPRVVDLKSFHSAEGLVAWGGERLKEGLMALGLKCGGTVEQRAERLFSTKGKKKEEIDKKLWAKPAAAGAGGGGGGKNKEANGAVNGHEAGGKGGGGGGGGGEKSNSQKQCAWVEFKVGLLVGSILSETVVATKKHVEKKQTRTKEEREAELKEEEEGVLPEIRGEGEEDDDDDDDDDDGPIYNPLNLPLGYDGKPIPYWLYKLHGLGVEYKCEICGNHSYWGRRAFDRHFQEWRHAHGMRCLGIPNTKHFHDITTIEDAQTLYNKIKDQLRTEVYDADVEEEFEDSEGNVLNRRTFEDLARQGLL